MRFLQNNDLQNAGSHLQKKTQLKRPLKIPELVNVFSSPQGFETDFSFSRRKCPKADRMTIEINKT